MSALDRFEALHRRDPANLLFRFSYAKALLEAGRVADAAEHLAACADAQADWMMARILLGKALLELGRPSEAKPVLAAALALARVQNHEDPAEELEGLLAKLG